VVNQRYLKFFGIEENPEWLSNKSIISHFETPDIGINKLMAVGLNSIHLGINRIMFYLMVKI
jgi:hypothetical protein